jgi:hypothetical protein
MCRSSRVYHRAVRAILAGVVLSISVGTPAFAQAPPAGDPNPGAITFTGGLDVPTLYYFRGIRQEVEQKVTLWPYGDIGIALSAGDGAVKSTALNFGVWNSLHTGSSGSDVEGRPGVGMHYEEDFYATFTLGFDKGISWATSYIAYTSPNDGFDTVKEIDLKVSKSGMIAPYGLLAFEIGGDTSGQADSGHLSDGKKGTYLELGAGPNWALAGGKATLTIPIKLGVSLKDYYESPVDGKDNKLGFFDVGALVTIPLTGVPSQFGMWNIHGGADFLAFGDTTKAFNVNKDGETKSSKVVALFGIGVTY